MTQPQTQQNFYHTHYHHERPVMSLDLNPYYSIIDGVVVDVKSRRADGLTWSDAWQILGGAVGGVQKHMADLLTWSTEDEQQIKEASGAIFDKYLEPLNAPGPDVIVDPILRTTFVSIVWGGAQYVAEKLQAA